MQPRSWSTNLLWKIATAFALAAALWAIYDNGNRVERLEQQVCDTVTESNDRLAELEYYRFHPGERQDAEDANAVVLARFHCGGGDGASR